MPACDLRQVKGVPYGLALKGYKSMRPVNLITKDELIDRAERWPVPIVVLVATCVAMTFAAVWA
jgi:hypothetical protein